MGMAIPPQANMGAIASALLGDATPAPESTTPTAGARPMASRDDHAHQRLTSVTGHTCDGNGEAVVAFTQAFAPAAAAPTFPGLACAFVQVAGQMPIIAWEVKSWATDANGNYTGCVIKAYRAKPLPTQTQLTGITLLTQLVAGLNAVLASLTNFDITGGSAAGAVFSCIAVKRSTAST